MMTRKHYKTIAKIIGENRLKDDAPSWRMVKKLTDYFADDNPRFDRQKFIKACL